MRVVLVFAAVTACTQSSSSQAPVSSGSGGYTDPEGGHPYQCPAQTSPLPLCTVTCGNGQIDQCDTTMLDGLGCTVYSPETEQCDGASVPQTCADLGYYGGTLRCSSQCLYDVTPCATCAAGDIACVTVARLGIWEIVPNGPNIGVVSDHALSIFDGTTLAPIATVTSPTSNFIRGVATPNGGWLLASEGPATLVPIDANGTIGTPQRIDSITAYGFAFGPGGRAIVAWAETTTVYYELVDASGQIVVPKTKLLGGNGDLDETQPRATTDGTSFFVAAHGTLARIAPDGTATFATGFPPDPSSSSLVVATWGGTTGWYVVLAPSGYVAQRFGASGEPVGGAISLGDGATADGWWTSLFVADGDALVGLQISGAQAMPAHLSVVSISASGAFGTPHEVGLLGGFASEAGLAAIGGNVVVASSNYGSDGHTQLALAAP